MTSRNDTMEQEQAYEALAYERAQLLAIFDSIEGIIEVVDPISYEVLYVNEYAKRLYGDPKIGGLCHKEFYGFDTPCDFCNNDLVLRQKDKTHRRELHNRLLKRDFVVTNRVIRWPDGRDAKLAVFLDITDRKKMEDALRKSEERYRELVEMSDDIAYRTDAGGVFNFVNQVASRITGYSEAELIGLHYTDIILPEYREASEKFYGRQFVKKIPTTYYELPIRSKTGEVIWVGQNVQLLTKDEEVVGFQAIVRDITRTKMAEEALRKAKEDLETKVRERTADLQKANEQLQLELTDRKRAEEALRQSEAKYRFLIEHGSDLIWTLDLNLRTTFVTPSVEKVLGFTPEERMQQKVEDQLTPESLKQARQRLLEELNIEREQGIQEGKSALVDLDYYHKNGSLVCLQTAVSFIRDEKGTPTGIHGISRDITALKRAQDALMESAELLAEAQRVAKIGNWSYDLRKNKVTWSDELYRIFGIELSDFDGRYQSVLNRVHPEDRHLVVQTNDLARNEGKPFDFEYRIILPGGQVRAIREIGQADKDDAGNIIRLFGIAQDITDRKEAERERERLRNELFQAQKMEAIGTLTGGIAHDFNNLLTIINGYTELALSETPSDSPSYSDLVTVLETGLKGAELVQRLLMLTKKGNSNPQPLDLNRIVENAAALMKRTFPKMIEIETVLAQDLSMVNADAAQLDQALMNLCINAEEAMPEGGKLRIETKNVIVDEADCKFQVNAKPGPNAVIEVSDTGAGMDAETLDRLFDPFFTTKGWDFKKGTGLGLPVAKGILEQNGGWITCESEPGKGSIFRIYLPAIGESATARKAESGPPAVPHIGKILLVDDEDSLLDLAKRVLERAGYDVITASNGKEALDIYARQQSSIAVVVLDLIMPQMGGRKCLEGLLRLNPDVKVLVSTGHSLTQDEQASLGVLAKGFVNKPFQLEGLLRAVRDALS